MTQTMTPEAIAVAQTIFRSLLRLMPKAKKYAEPAAHSANKLVQYFSMLTFCLLTRNEKLAFSEYFKEFWNLFHPEMCQSKIQQHLNKQALLVFWYHACQDCPENVVHIYRNKEVSQKLPFNYIMVDNDDQELVAFNKLTLPAYYGLLRLAAQQNRLFLRQLSAHENVEWAFKNIAAHSTIYVNAAEELFLMMEIFAEKPPPLPPHASSSSLDNHKEEMMRASTFRKNTLTTFLNSYQKGQWQTLITVFRILVDTDEERLNACSSNALSRVGQVISFLHEMHHEATACHVMSDLVQAMRILNSLLASLKNLLLNGGGADGNPNGNGARRNSNSSASSSLKSSSSGMSSSSRNASSSSSSTAAASLIRTYIQQWKDVPEVMRKLLSLLNSYASHECRQVCMKVFSGWGKLMVKPIIVFLSTQYPENLRIHPFVCVFISAVRFGVGHVANS